MTAHRAAIDSLACEDQRLRDELGPLKSLCPGRATATPLAQIGERWLTNDVEPRLAERYAAVLVDIFSAQAEHYPHNLFWDYDLPAKRLFDVLLAQAPCAAEQRLEERRDMLVRLQSLFGSQSRIQFRYVHDFVYGFDWARWVGRESQQRAGIGPYDPSFLQYTLTRGAELLELIAKDDSKYPSLPRGEARNPFGFSRSDSQEERLLRDLVERDLVPVKAWDAQAVPAWNRPYAELREERARALGIWKTEP